MLDENILIATTELYKPGCQWPLPFRYRTAGFYQSNIHIVLSTPEYMNTVLGPALENTEGQIPPRPQSKVSMESSGFALAQHSVATTWVASRAYWRVLSTEHCA